MRNRRVRRQQREDGREERGECRVQSAEGRVKNEECRAGERAAACCSSIK